jgi:leucine dehydrogenase
MSFELIKKHGDHEEVIFCHNKDVGLKAIIAIHNTALGPALGGTRMWNYKSDEEALIDVLRLSRGMTYKASAAGLNLGGGKAVIIGDSRTEKSEGLFRAFGTFVNSLGGKYITAEDVGTTVKDMEYVYSETPFVTGIPESLGGSGDPSPYTAYGVLMSIKASVKKKLNKDDLNGVHVAVQGMGNVGRNLVKFLDEEGAKITVADIDEARVDQMCSVYNSVEKVGPDDIASITCDVFAPCALGAVINDESIHNLKCDIIAGGANNVLAEHRHGDILLEKGILYAPDFVGNSGGLMNVYVELEGYSKDRAMQKVEAVYDNIMEVFEIAEKENVPTYKAAQILAKRRVEVIGRLRQHHQGRHARPFSSLRQVLERQSSL